MVRGIAQGTPTKHLAAELGIDRGHLLERRHDIQAVLARRLSPLSHLGDMVTETDELYQMLARKAANTLIQQTRRAAVPITPVVTAPGRVIDRRLQGWSAVAAGTSACRSVTTAIVQRSSPLWKRIPVMMRRSTPMNGRPIADYQRQAACIRPSAMLQDIANGRGMMTVMASVKSILHTNTIEGIWTGLRNFLRPFRGVSKWFLDQYSAVFEWAHNLKRVTADFLRAMMLPFTSKPI
jgi:hypothetical protein